MKKTTPPLSSNPSFLPTQAPGGEAGSDRATKLKEPLEFVESFKPPREIPMPAIPMQAIQAAIPMPAIRAAIPMPAIPMPAIPMPAIPMQAIQAAIPMQGIPAPVNPMQGIPAPVKPMDAVDIDYLLYELDELQNSAMNDRFPYLYRLDDCINMKLFYDKKRGRHTENNLNSLHIAAITGDNIEVENILTKGLPINTQVPIYELTPLHLAVILGNTKTVKALLENGADTKKADCRGRTASDLAPIGLDPETAKKIIGLIEEHELKKRIDKIINVHPYNLPPLLPANYIQPDIQKSVQEMLGSFKKPKLDNEQVVQPENPAPLARTAPPIKRQFPPLDEYHRPRNDKTEDSPSSSPAKKGKLFDFGKFNRKEQKDM